MLLLKPLLDAHAQVRAQRTPEDQKALEEQKLFRLKYIQEIAKTVVIVAKAFMNAILSLVSGSVAAVSGFFQVKKLVISGKSEIRTMKMESYMVPTPPKTSEKHSLVAQKSGKHTKISKIGGVKFKYVVKPLATATEVPTPEKPQELSQFQIDGGTITFIVSFLVFIVLRFVGKRSKPQEPSTL